MPAAAKGCRRFTLGDGMILTNAHNLRGPETTVTFADGRRVTGEIRGVDVDSDVAVIAADTGGVAPPEWAGEGLAGPVDKIAIYKIKVLLPPQAAQTMQVNPSTQAGVRVEAEIPLGHKPLIKWFFERSGS